MSNNTDITILKVISIVFNAALGDHFYKEIRPKAGSKGENLDALIKSLGELSEVKLTLGTTALEQAQKLTASVGLDSNAPTGSPGREAFNYFFTNLAAGANAASLALEAVRFLDAQPYSSPFATAKSYVNHRAEAAQYFTLGLKLGGTDISLLQAAIVGVDTSRDSVDSSNIRNTSLAIEQGRVKNQSQKFTDQDDLIRGNDTADFIEAGIGKDSVSGRVGDDTIFGDGGFDLIDGGLNDDIIDGGEGADTLYGSLGADVIFGRNGNDTIYAWVEALKQNDSSTFDMEKNYLYGGDGNDRLEGAYGGDVIDGGLGNDFIDADPFVFDQRKKVTFDVSQTLGHDLIIGGDGNDTIKAGFGDDTIYGSAGNDSIDGGTAIGGAKFIDGGIGNDIIEFFPSLRGVSGVVGEYVGKVSTVIGGDGQDRIDISGSSMVDGGEGDDSLNLSGLFSNDQFFVKAGEGSDYIGISAPESGSRSTIDLSEKIAMSDTVDFSYKISTLTFNDILGFDLTKDKIGLSYSFNLYGTSTATRSFSTNTSGGVFRDFVQLLNSPKEQYLTPLERPTTKDDYGKAFFVILNASAKSASRADVAALIDQYGSNAKYDANEAHAFIVNIDGQGMGIYSFNDDSGANNEVTADEITPVAILVGLDTNQLVSTPLVIVA